MGLVRSKGQVRSSKKKSDKIIFGQVRSAIFWTQIIVLIQTHNYYSNHTFSTKLTKLKLLFSSSRSFPALCQYQDLTHQVLLRSPSERIGNVLYQIKEHKFEPYILYINCISTDLTLKPSIFCYSL